YRVTWEARNAMYGRAVAQGEWALPGYTADAAARFQRLDMPITAQGQYWVTLKVRNTRQSSFTAPTTKDMVIKVVRGDEAQMPVLSADIRPQSSLLVLNPQRTQNIYAPGELQQALIRVWRPLNQDTNDFQLKTAQEAYPSGALGSEVTTSVHFAAGDQYVDVPVQLALQDGRPLVTLTAKLMAGNQTLDSLTQRLGQRELVKVEPWTNRDKVLRYADIFENGNHLLCCAEWDARYLTSTDMAKFAEWVEDVKRQNVNTIELFPSWREVEPMPGVFYWDQLDARLQVIAQHGMRVMINLDSTYPPAWVVEESQADEEGMVNGLWGGGSNNVLKSPSSRTLYQAYGEYLTHMALRYRNNPALVAYSSLSIFFDHVWADHPWLGQYVDYSEAARAGFRSYLRDVRGFSLANLAARWHTKLASWNDVELPRTDLFLGLATIDRPDPRPEWRDFLDFRQWSEESYFTQLLAGTVRQYDDLRPIGTHGPHADISWYRANNMFVCAGSSEGSLDMFRKARFPLPTRSESILMSFYTPYYTAMSMTNLLAANNFNVQDFWMPWWRWENSGDERRKTGTQALAGWQALVQGDLGKATPVHAAAGAKPILGLLDTRASILYGVRSFHWFRLDDYKMLADRACLMPHQLLQEDATADDLAALPCVVVDPTARIMPQAMMDRLVTYVKNGGKLVLPPTGGSFTEDPADGVQVLRRKLGLPMPTAKWTMAAEYRQPGKYNPHYPAGVTGKGTPGQQSLGEPNQTATAKTLGTIFPAGQQLVFRLGPYTMYNRDTWGDWSHMLPYFIYGRYQEKAVSGTPIATWNDGGPAATLHTVGKGQVIVLWGTPDWYNWREALSAIAAWASPTATTALSAAPQPYAVTPDTAKGFLLVKDDIRWAVLRNEAQGWTGIYNASVDEQAKATRSRQTITLRDLSAAKYRVRDITPLLTQGYDQVLTREQLAQQGISADLIPSETRIFRLDPLP
ncbi:MAG TPA: alpha-amylase family protein, partial [Armatimonadota bacterium]